MKNILVTLSAVMITGCVQLSLESSDFAWPIETVLSVDNKGFIEENRYSFSTNVKALFIDETADSVSYNNTEVRIIRDYKGYYFMTSAGFKHVYVFKINDGSFDLYNKIFVSEFGLDLPALNQRKPYIEVLDGEEHLVFMDSEGIKGEEN